ncbi:hypothetical protein PR003_g7111 [Phytophthora rubi]|uniref:MULE transposase domain-containing protein n=1 Tax=Phytophthora rubi TaxID=129364 RepID=A0A6A4FEY2_9STRA|nr:hypothetical protein PR001_g28582 [Phytophthora rubi]KAE9347089.1 hypothetical protein PR003_g7111 [Phytophthora rubi]
MVCTVCGGAEPHKMRYRLLECSSDTCYEASDMKCAWRGKLLTCLQTHLISIYEIGERTIDATAPKRIKLTETQKAFCREMAENHLRPMRIRHALSRKFSTPLDALPSLKAVQNFVNHYARTYLENHDRVDELRKWIHARNYTGAEEITQPFTFGWELDGVGKPVVGNGLDERPFIIGISTKALILRMLLLPDRFILHIDATYKMNYREYPVVVIGVSDRSRGFHVVALFIVSQETQPVFEAVLRSLCRMFYWITQKELIVTYAMADADQAQYNALQSVFGRNPHFHPLMCFFHGMEKVQKAIKGFPSLVASAVVRDVYDLHFARSHTEFMQLRERILKAWNADPMLLAFSQYMTGQ